MKEKIKDDWMYPSRGSVSYTPTPPKEFIIQRMKAPPICTWAGSPPRAGWELWAEFDTEKERDEELNSLRETTEWILRPARQSIIGGHVYDVEPTDEEADLLARLDEIRAKKRQRKK